jgi:FemAB-related protein (PEP-CTERM system-associated)
VALSRDPAWLSVLQRGLGHEIYALEAISNGRTCGFLPLAFVSSVLFGRFLISLPYLNSNGVIADAPDVQTLLVRRAVELAEELNVRFLELRHEKAVEQPDLTVTISSKVHMRLALPRSQDKLWKSYDPKVRNQVRKGEKSGFAVEWGGAELLPGFYAVLCENMRDLGSPVYGRAFFEEILTAFPGRAEICLLRDGERPIASALLLHGWGVTEVPTASSLRDYNPSCVNMFMYQKLLERSVDRGQAVFDFGRSTLDGNTFKFKKQWGAEPHPAAWQYHIREGTVTDMRPDNPRYQRMIRLWQKLPVRLTQYLGPIIVRGLP